MVVVGRSVVMVLWEDDVCVWSADLRDVIKQEQHVRDTSRGNLNRQFGIIQLAELGA